MLLGSFGMLASPEHDGQEVPIEVVEVPERIAAAPAAVVLAFYQVQTHGVGIGEAADTAEVRDRCMGPLMAWTEDNNLTQDEYLCSMSLFFQVMAEMASLVAVHI
jgi:hypothetical protein